MMAFANDDRVEPEIAVPPQSGQRCAGIGISGTRPPGAARRRRAFHDPIHDIREARRHPANYTACGIWTSIGSIPDGAAQVSRRSRVAAVEPLRNQ
jgi:hypothetical protein